MTCIYSAQTVQCACKCQFLGQQANTASVSWQVQVLMTCILSHLKTASVSSKTEGAYGQLIIGATWQLTMACAFTAASCLHLVSLHPNPNANREVTTAKGASLLATGVPLITKRAVWVHCDDLHFFCHTAIVSWFKCHVSGQED